MSRHVMLDIETLGNKPYSVILSVGAVVFNKNGINGKFYHRLEIDPQIEAGLTVDGSTIKWWFNQSSEAQMRATMNELSPTLVLEMFRNWVEAEPEDLYIWGNGATFDNVLFSNLYDAFNIYVPWKFRNNRCYRTIKNQYDDITIPEEDDMVRHDALEDAKWQAKHLIKILHMKDLELK